MIKELIINRAKWLLPNTSNEDSCLLADDGKMCCLGMFAKQSGLKPKLIAEAASLSHLADSTARTAASFTRFSDKFGLFLCDTSAIANNSGYSDSVVGKNLMAINDCGVGLNFNYCYKNGIKLHILKSQKHREELLTKEFAKVGVAVSFINELDLLDDEE